MSAFQNYGWFGVPKGIDASLNITNGPLRFTISIFEYDEKLIAELNNDGYDVDIIEDNVTPFNSFETSLTMVISELRRENFDILIPKCRPLARFTAVGITSSYSALKQEFDISHVMEVVDRSTLMDTLVEMDQYFHIMHVENQKTVFMIGKEEIEDLDDVIIHQQIMGRNITTIK